MTQRFGFGIRHRIAVSAVALGAGGGGCDRTLVPVTWAANGVQLTRLDMPATSPRQEKK